MSIYRYNALKEIKINFPWIKRKHGMVVMLEIWLLWRSAFVLQYTIGRNVRTRAMVFQRSLSIEHIKSG